MNVSALFNRPAMLHPGARGLAMSLLSDDRPARLPRMGSAPELAIVGGVAVVPVKGILFQRLGWMGGYGEYLGVGGYDVIAAQLAAAAASSDVRAIVLDIDSPGGDVAGCFDLVDDIFALRKVKPIHAILGERALSAAYAIASAAESITVPRTGETGSVGVIYMHLSVAEMAAKAGIAVTLITDGAHKGELNEFVALSDEARARAQADVDTVGALFRETVARNRDLPLDRVRDTQAGTFLGKAGVEIGFADAVKAPDDAFVALLTQLG
ncbi:MAG: S49 family peptidase [Sphingomonadaceae bacterium]|nr:S49 family peptidase [Sphingomonadaceae bacterium]